MKKFTYYLLSGSLLFFCFTVTAIGLVSN